MVVFLNGEDEKSLLACPFLYQFPRYNAEIHGRFTEDSLEIHYFALR